MSLVKLVVTTTTTTTTTNDRQIHRPIESRARPRRDSTPCRGRGSRMGWGGVGSSRVVIGQSVPRRARPGITRWRFGDVWAYKIPTHRVFSHRVRTHGARRGSARDAGSSDVKKSEGDVYVTNRAAARGRWMDRKGKNLFIEARARCRRKNDRACGSVSSAPRARRRRRRRRRPNRRRRAI